MSVPLDIACGYGTSYGCCQAVTDDARLIINARRTQARQHPINGRSLSPHVLFHTRCLPDVALVAAYSVGLAAEMSTSEPVGERPPAGSLAR